MATISREGPIVATPATRADTLHELSIGLPGIQAAELQRRDVGSATPNSDLSACRPSQGRAHAPATTWPAFAYGQLSFEARQNARGPALREMPR